MLIEKNEICNFSFMNNKYNKKQVGIKITYTLKLKPKNNMEGIFSNNKEVYKIYIKEIN